MIDLKSKTQAQANLLERMKNRNWLDNNIKEVQEKYGEKWIAIAREQIIASGKDLDEIREKIKEEAMPKQIILLKVPTGAISRPA
jgi:hypothetical protein